MDKPEDTSNYRKSPGAAEFAKMMSNHGHPFQYKTLKEAEDAPAWVIQVSEFPVEVRGTPTRIDLFPSRASWSQIARALTEDELAKLSLS